MIAPSEARRPSVRLLDIDGRPARIADPAALAETAAAATPARYSCPDRAPPPPGFGSNAADRADPGVALLRGPIHDEPSEDVPAA
jgi:hypothetical protein